MPLSSRNRATVPGEPILNDGSAHLHGKRGRSRLIRVCVLLTTALAAVWPVVVHAATNPPRPSWDPGPPWAPLHPHSAEVKQISDLFWIMLAISGVVFVAVTGALII